MVGFVLSGTPGCVKDPVVQVSNSDGSSFVAVTQLPVVSARSRSTWSIGVNLDRDITRENFVARPDQYPDIVRL